MLYISTVCVAAVAQARWNAQSSSLGFPRTRSCPHGYLLNLFRLKAPPPSSSACVKRGRCDACQKTAKENVQRTDQIKKPSIGRCLFSCYFFRRASALFHLVGPITLFSSPIFNSESFLRFLSVSVRRRGWWEREKETAQVNETVRTGPKRELSKDSTYSHLSYPHRVSPAFLSVSFGSFIHSPRHAMESFSKRTKIKDTNN